MSRAWLLCWIAAAGTATAGDDVVYRCTDANGAVTLQNAQPCPPGQRQRIIEIDVPPPLPAYVPPPPPPAPQADAAPAAAPGDDGAGADADRVRLPPPPLYRCTSWDGERRLTADATPAVRCRPLHTVGIGGLSGLGAGAACERVEDACEPVPEDALCHAWDGRVREAEFRWKVASGRREIRERRAEYEALAATYAASTCAG